MGLVSRAWLSESGLFPGESAMQQLHTACTARVTGCPVSPPPAVRAVWCLPRLRQTPRAVLGAFFSSFATPLSSVSSASVSRSGPVGRASLGQALAVCSLSSPPHAVPSQLAQPLLTPVLFVRCFIKELRPCFVSVGVLQRERTIRMCAYGEIYFKEVALMIVVAGKSEIYTASQLAGNPGRTSWLLSGGRIPSPGNLKCCS